MTQPPFSRRTFQIKPPDAALILVLALAALACLARLDLVPFHPDEATRLFTSAELENAFTNPASLAWEPGKPLDARMQYRLLDAPLANYLIGLGRLLGGYQAPTVDWNWSASWDENKAAGALPSDELLAWARLVPALLLPLSAPLVYLCFRRLGLAWAGVAAAALLAFNPLMLLHTRRAMAESSMIFSLSLLVYLLVRFPHKPILLGLAAGLAVCAKQSLLVVVLFGLAAAGYFTWLKSASILQTVRSCVVFLLAAAGLFILLNPFLWKHPSGALQASFHARQELLSRNVTELGRIDPLQIAGNPLERAGFLIAQAFIVPPAAEDVGNYQAALAPQEQAYFSFLPHRWLRGLLPGGFVLFLSLVGFVGWPFWKFYSRQQRLALTGLAFLSTAVFLSLAAAVPLPFQRYSLPVLFFGLIWAAVGAAQVYYAFRRSTRAAASSAGLN